jgi:hypothetical protein
MEWRSVRGARELGMGRRGREAREELRNERLRCRRGGALRSRGCAGGGASGERCAAGVRSK